MRKHTVCTASIVGRTFLSRTLSAPPWSSPHRAFEQIEHRHHHLRNPRKNCRNQTIGFVRQANLRARIWRVMSLTTGALQNSSSKANGRRRIREVASRKMGERREGVTYSRWCRSACLASYGWVAQPLVTFHQPFDHSTSSARGYLWYYFF